MQNANSKYIENSTGEILTKLELSRRYNVSFGAVVEKYEHFLNSYVQETEENSTENTTAEPVRELESTWYLVHEGTRPVADYTHNVVTDDIQCIDGVYYQTYTLVEKSEATLKVNTRNTRDMYLREYIDNNINNPLQWQDMSDTDKIIYIDYRRYLLDYTQRADWWKTAPMTLEEWKDIYTGDDDEDEEETTQDISTEAEETDNSTDIDVSADALEMWRVQ